MTTAPAQIKNTTVESSFIYKQNMTSLYVSNKIMIAMIITPNHKGIQKQHIGSFGAEELMFMALFWPLYNVDIILFILSF